MPCRRYAATQRTTCRSPTPKKAAACAALHPSTRTRCMICPRRAAAIWWVSTERLGMLRTLDPPLPPSACSGEGAAVDNAEQGRSYPAGPRLSGEVDDDAAAHLAAAKQSRADCAPVRRDCVVAALVAMTPAVRPAAVLGC